MCGGGSSSYSDPKNRQWGGGGSSNNTNANYGNQGGGLRLNEWPTMGPDGQVNDPRYKGTAGRQNLDFGHYENGHWMEHNPGGSEQGDHPAVAPTTPTTPTTPPVAPVQNPQYWGDLDQQWKVFSARPQDWAPGTDMEAARLAFMNAGGMGGTGNTAAPFEMGDPGAVLQAPYQPYAAPQPPAGSGTAADLLGFFNNGQAGLTAYQQWLANNPNAGTINPNYNPGFM